MPLYEYECGGCGERSEILQRLSEPALEHCPRCGGALRKLPSAPAFQLKGSGWYKTDYAAKSAGSSGEAATGAPSASGESGANAAEKPAASESKPATAPAEKSSSA